MCFPNDFFTLAGASNGGGGGGGEEAEAEWSWSEIDGSPGKSFSLPSSLIVAHKQGLNNTLAKISPSPLVAVE